MMKNREIELKLQINDVEEVALVRAYLADLAQRDSAELQKYVMKAVYYDTESGFFQKHRMAYRIRQENKSIIATYKSGTVNKNGVFERVEVNRNVYTLEPDISVFQDELPVWKMLKAVENSKFIAIVKSDFKRECITVKWQEAQIEIALDLGEITGKNKKSPICEVELELKSGSEQALLTLKDALLKKFNMVYSTVSKYQRGLILAGLST